MNTHQITVRKVDSLLKQRIASSAKLKSQSVNDWVLDAMKDKAGMGAGGSVHKEPSWKKLAGSFSKDAIDEKSLREFDKISPKMWD